MWPFKADRHKRWREQLSAYIDERLEASEREALERHLATCASCTGELESLRATVALLRRMPQVAVPRSFRLTEAPAPPRVPWPVRYALPLRYATAAAAALLLTIALGDILLLSGGVEESAIAPLRKEATTPAPAATTAPPAMAAPASEAVEESASATPSPAPAQPAAAPEPAAQEIQGLPDVSTTAGREALNGDFQVTDETLLEEEPDEPSTLSTLLDWLQVGLGSLLVVLVALQWWLRRRSHTQQ